jgi:cell wall assembly regulator SMI1
VQKFTRALTREIEVAGERLALTLSEQGLSVRPVGSRKPPREVSWAAVLARLAAGGDATPSADEAAAAVAWVKGGAPRQAKAPAEPKSAEQKTAEPARSGDLNAVLGRLDRWLAEHRPRYHEGLRPGASPAELDALQNELAIPLPADLRTLLAWHNGQNPDFLGAFAQSWNLMGTRLIAEAKKELDADGADLGWQKAWVPFLEDDSGDFVVVDTGQPSAPVREVWQGQKEHPVAAPSLAVWLDQFVRDVEQGRYVEDPERGTFLRRREGEPPAAQGAR